MATIPSYREIYPKVFIGRPDGMTYEDITDFVQNIEIELGDVSSVGTGNTGADGVVRRMDFTVADDSEDGVFAPQNQLSIWNQFASQYSALLWPMRKVYCRVAIVADQSSGSTSIFDESIGTGTGSLAVYPLDFSPVLDGSVTVYVDGTATSNYSIDYNTGEISINATNGAVLTADYTYYRTIFVGYLGDNIDVQRTKVTCSCRDLAKRLQRTYIEVSREYGTDAGVPAETVMQSILDDNGLTDITLQVPVSPGFNITPYELEYKSVWDALQEIVSQFGWYLGYLWDATTNDFQLTLLEPPRAKDLATVDFAFTAEDDIYINNLSFSDVNVRNALKLTYTDVEAGEQVTLNADDFPLYLKDQDSIDEFGRISMEIVEKDTSLIDTQQEALDFGKSIIDDLKSVGATDKLTLPLLPELDVFAGISVDDSELSTDVQFFGVESLRHSFNFGEDATFRTEAICSGKVTGGRQRWLQMQTRPGYGEPIRGRNIVDNSTVVYVAAKDTPLRKRNLATYICDGVADQVQINKAIDSFTNGGKVVLFEGTYTIDASIVLKTNISIEGQGYSTEIKLKDGHNADIALMVNIDPVSDITLQSFKLDGNRTTNSSGTQHGIFFQVAENISINQVHVTDLRNQGVTFGVDTTECVISDCIVTRCNSYGVILTSNTTISRCLVNLNHIAIATVATSDNIIITNNLVTANDLKSIALNNTTNTLVNNNTIVAGSFIGSTRQGLEIDGGSENINVDSNIFIGHVYGLEVLTTSNVSVKNNKCRNNGAGIVIRNTALDTLVSNNDCYNGGTSAGIFNESTSTNFGAGNRNNDGTFSTTPN